MHADMCHCPSASFSDIVDAQTYVQILDAMEYAVYAYDVRHIVLDNLQFMTASTTGKRGDSNIFQVRCQI